MNLSDAIRCRLKELIKYKKITPYALSIKAGSHPSTLTYFLNGDTKMLTLDTFLHYCEALDIELYDFFMSPFFKDVQSE